MKPKPGPHKSDTFLGDLEKALKGLAMAHNASRDALIAQGAAFDKLVDAINAIGSRECCQGCKHGRNRINLQGLPETLCARDGLVHEPDGYCPMFEETNDD